MLTLTKNNLKGIAVSNVVFVNEKETMASSTTIRSPINWNFMDFDANTRRLYGIKNLWMKVMRPLTRSLWQEIIGDVRDQFLSPPQRLQVPLNRGGLLEHCHHGNRRLSVDQHLMDNMVDPTNANGLRHISQSSRSKG